MGRRKAQNAEERDDVREEVKNPRVQREFDEPLDDTAGEEPAKKHVPPPETGKSPNKLDHLPDFLVSMGHQYGLTDEDMVAMSAKSVEIYVSRMHQQQQANLNAMVERERQKKPDVHEVKAEPVVEKDDWEDLTDEYPDELKSKFSKVGKHLSASKKKIAELEDKLAKMTNASQQEKVNSMFRAFDEAFEELAPEYGHLFGTGSAMNGTVSQIEMQRRGMLVSQITDQDTPASAKKKIKELASLLPKGGAPKEEEQPVSALDKAKADYASGTIVPPKQRDPAKLPYGRARAEASLAAALSKRGSNGTANGSSDEFEL